MQKRKTTPEPAPQGNTTAGAGALSQNKWEEIFTSSGDGKYSMEQWNPCYKFKPAYGNLSYGDPQPRMRMTISIGKMAVIVDAFTALLAEPQTCKKTRRGTFFGTDREDKAPKELHIYGGWPDWWGEEFDFEYEALMDSKFEEALWRQEQLGALLGRCEQLESLRLENMEFYKFKVYANVQDFFANLRGCAKLKKLAVVNNAYGGGDLPQIIPEVRKLPLRELDLSGNRLYREKMFPVVAEERARETAFVELLGTLGECKTLEALSLADMRLRFKTPDDESTRLVLRLMQELPLLTALKLGKNRMSPEVQVAIETAAPATLVVEF